ncbi:MAG TPA: hypothetical protein VN770_00235 [Gaiellaceae bacterium]|nr:hypothetical protein [Gaiellaceae bacterium]
MDSLRSTFDRVAELYDRARPSYPAALIDDVAALGPRILEIGPGRDRRRARSSSVGRR